MKIKRIGLRGFGVHHELVLELPERGVVLLHGPNGAGKSTVLEAVSACAWAKPLRGEKIPTTKGSTVAIELSDGTTVRRHYGKSRDSVEVMTPDGAHEKPVTATKAAPLIESHLGTWEAWRRTHVLSVHDAQHFSLASDKERKSVLEGLLGLERFGPASKRVGELARNARNAHREAQAQQQYATQAEGTARAHRDEITALVTPADHTDPELLAHAITTLQPEYADVLAYIRSTTDRLGQLAAAPPTQCPTCAQPWPEHVDRASLAAETVQLRVDRDRAEQHRSSLAQELGSLQGMLAAARAAQQQRAQFEGAAARALEAHDNATHALYIAAERETETARELEIVEALVKTFAPAGPRATLLREALVRVAASATRWVSKISDGWGVELPLGSTGRQVDAIQLAVGPVGARRSYRACSNGERRRVDVGLCLALRELGSLAGSAGAGTLWADDMFDGLDPDGQARLADVLREEAQHVAVVVLAPSPEIASLLRPAKIVEITPGGALAT